MFEKPPSNKTIQELYAFIKASGQKEHEEKSSYEDFS
jgi:hypothetical protein